MNTTANKFMNTQEMKTTKGTTMSRTVDDGYFVISKDVPKFDPRNGFPLTYLENN